jgi:Cu2+-exporting ATPase
MCCPGCQAVATAIIAGGFDQYYQFRTQAASTAQQLAFDQRQFNDEFVFCDDAQLQQSFVTRLSADEVETRLGIDDIHCAACCWLIENALRKLIGVTHIAVNLGSHRATLRWNPSQIKLSQILRQLQQLGYHALPFRADGQQQQQAQSRRTQWLRLGVAAMVMMQAGMFSFALYSGSFTGIAVEHQRLLQILGLLMTAPVMFFSATPFFRGAWRCLRAGQLGMDVPVSLALWVAFSASVYTAITGIGDVYFDSISMFVFLLLLARFAESSARQHFFAAEVADCLPLMCRVCVDGQTAPLEKRVAEVMVQDRLQIRPGEVMAFDGVIVSGQSSINESAFSGEALPVIKTIGDSVYAGTLNGEGLLIVEVRKALGQARLDVIGHLAQRSEAQKPAVALLADAIARHFTLVVLLLAVGSGVYWGMVSGVQHAIAIVISVLVVSCPCALSLATPAALAFCYQSLRQQGLWVISGDLLARMHRIDVVVFDKTGTLTQGEFALQSVQLTASAAARNNTQAQLTEIAAALERVSGHPMASAFRSIATDWQVEAVKILTGLGVEGRIHGERYRIGSRQFCEQWGAVVDPVHPVAHAQPIYLATPQNVLAIFWVRDAIRPEAFSVVQALQKNGLRVMMLSGDSSGAAEQVAQQLGIDECLSGLSPEQKLAHLSTLQKQHQVMMVGDGINDIPVLAQADVSIAMNTASDLAKVKADAILLRNHLSALLALFQHCRATRRIIHQNLYWALLYNGVALPAAVMGLVPAWLAAIGMSASSLWVTLNSVRLRKIH